MRARDNPYRAEKTHSLEFRFAGMDWERFGRRFVENGARGCVLGPEGSGKTTLLLAFSERLGNAGVTVNRVVIRADDEAWKDDLENCHRFGPRDVLLVDGADLLGRLEWRRLRRQTARAFGVLASSHRRRLLPVLYRCVTSPELLRDIVQELHPGSGCGQPGPLELFKRHNGNIRDAIRELYDYHAGLPSSEACRLCRAPA